MTSPQKTGAFKSREYGGELLINYAIDDNTHKECVKAIAKIADDIKSIPFSCLYY